jgi:nucleotide-binding universal stress UspA family protein
LHDLAEEREAIAAVVGSSDRGPVGRVLPGSTAERLLHGAPCAIAVAARGCAEQGLRLLRVGVACDGSPEATLALDAGVTITRRCNSTLTLLTVAQTVSLAYTPAAVAAMPLSDLQATEKRRMREQLDRSLDQVPGDLLAHGRLLQGVPGAALVDVSEDFDLILVGSRGYGPLRRTLLGSTSRHLLNSARCSVMAMPRGIDPDLFGSSPSS